MAATPFKPFKVLAAVVCLACAFMVVASWIAEAKDPSAAKSSPVVAAECKKDTDCALVPDDCCACSEGGGQRAIPKKQKGAYEKERQKRCAGTMCAQMISPHPSCSERAVCSAGICKLGVTGAH
jgi:hypothetical protein